MRILGQREATILSDAALEAKLKSRDLVISLEKLEDVKENVRLSTEGCLYLSNLLR